MTVTAYTAQPWSPWWSGWNRPNCGSCKSDDPPFSRPRSRADAFHSPSWEMIERTTESRREKSTDTTNENSPKCSRTNTRVLTVSSPCASLPRLRHPCTAVRKHVVVGRDIGTG